MACRRAIGPITSISNGIRTNGYRYFGQSDAERAYGDVGYRAEGNEVHWHDGRHGPAAGVAGTTPIEVSRIRTMRQYFTTPTRRQYDARK